MFNCAQTSSQQNSLTELNSLINSVQIQLFMVRILFFPPKYPPKICANITCISSSSSCCSPSSSALCRRGGRGGKPSANPGFEHRLLCSSKEVLFPNLHAELLPIAAHRAFNKKENQKDRFLYIYLFYSEEQRGRGRGRDEIHRWRRVGTS